MPCRVDVDVPGQQPVVEVRRVHVQVDDDLAGQLAGLRVLVRRPVRVRHQDGLLVHLVALEHVRPGGQRVQLVVGAGVLGLRHRGRLRQRRHVVEVRERRQQVELDRVRVRRRDRRQVPRLVLVRARVLRVRQQHGEVGRAVGQHGPVVGALDRVLDVSRGDRRAVLELQALLDVVGPHQAVVADRAEAGRDAGHQRVAAGAGAGLVGDQRRRPQPGHVERPGVVRVARVERVRGAAQREGQRAALLRRGVHHAGVPRVEGRVAAGRGTPAARAAGSNSSCRCLSTPRGSAPPRPRMRRTRACFVFSYAARLLSRNNRLRNQCPRGSSASRSPSPNRLKAMTVMKMARPGITMYMGSM